MPLKKSTNSSCLIPTAFETLRSAGIPRRSNLSLYQAINQNPLHAIQLATAFVTLKAAGITLEAYPGLYQHIILNAVYAGNLSSAFVLLKEAGAAEPEHQILYALLAQKAYVAERLTLILAALQEIKATLKDHQLLFQEAIRYIYLVCGSNLSMIFSAFQNEAISLDEFQALYVAGVCQVNVGNNLPTALNALRTIGARAWEHQSLFEAVIKRTTYARDIPAVFKLLREVGATLEEHQSLYILMIRNIGYFEEMSASFSALKSVTKNAARLKKLPLVLAALEIAGANIQAHQSLYIMAIKNIGVEPDLLAAFAVLKKAGITLQHHRVFYEAIIQKKRDAGKLSAVFTALTKEGFDYQEQAELYDQILNRNELRTLDLLDRLKSLGFKMPDDSVIMTEALIANNLDLLLWLEERGFRKNEHRYIYEAWFAGTRPLVRSPYAMLKIKYQHHQYVESHPLLNPVDEAYPAQREALEAIINKELRAEGEITEGPLNKSPATWTMEAILKRIAREDIATVNLRFDESLGYILTFNGEPEIYLTELLKLSNFNHIELSTEEVNFLGEKIEVVRGNSNKTPRPLNRLLMAKLPHAARIAIDCYVGNTPYKNINRLFRGVPQTTEEQYIPKIPQNASFGLLLFSSEPRSKIRNSAGYYSSLNVAQTKKSSRPKTRILKNLGYRKVIDDRLCIDLIK